MSKVKSVIFLVLGGLLAIFLYENWLPAPAIRIFGKELVTISNSLIIIICLTLGIMTGGIMGLMWSRRRERALLSQTGPEEAPEKQQHRQQEEQGADK